MRVKYLLPALALLFHLSLGHAQNCIPDFIHFKNQQDIDDFATNYPGCTVIEGDVCIGDCTYMQFSDITNLNGLAQVTKILGSLKIANNPYLTSLAGLENITVFEDDVIINVNVSLSSIDALQQAEIFKGQFTISNSPLIVSIEGFELVDTILGRFGLYSMDSLKTFSAFPNLRYSGGFSFGECDVLENIPDMQALEYVGDIAITYNDKLTHIPALPLLSVIDGKFIINGNDALPGIVGYENITRINGHVIFGKQGLESELTPWNIDAFHNLTYVGDDFDIYRSVLLTSIDGFEQLDSIQGSLVLDMEGADYDFPQDNRFRFIGGSISFTHVDSLRNLHCLSELDDIYNNLVIRSCPNFESFDGIQQVTTIGGKLILDILNLDDLSGLSHITSVGDGLRIIDCDSLVDLSGLEALSAINGELNIIRNDNLESLSGIDNIDPQSIHQDLVLDFIDVIIINNPLLTKCNVQSICQALRLYGKSYTIEGNAPGCSDINDLQCYDYGFSGVVFYDENQNKFQDTDEYGIRNSNVIIDGGVSTARTNSLGHYMFFTDEGAEHTLSLDVMDGWILTTDSASYSRIFHEGSSSNGGIDFGVFALIPAEDLEVSLSSAFTRCNAVVDFFLNYANTGTYDQDGNIVVIYDDNVSFVEAVPPPTFHDAGAHELVWHFDTLDAYEERNVLIKFQMPDESYEGEVIDFLVEGYFDSSGTDILMDTFAYSSIVRCAIDPNDKIVSPPGVEDEHYTLRDAMLTYTVRFENEGNAEAIDIIVNDTLDTNLNMSTFRVLNSSFPVLTNLDGHGVTFFFKNIWLQPQQQGFVTYEVKPHGDLPDFTLIENYAGIIFDFNQPIITNTTLNTLIESFCQDITVIIDTSICEGESFHGYIEDGIHFFDSISPVTGCEVEVQLLLGIIPDGTGGCVTTTNDASESQFKIYPNPVNKELFVESEKPIESLNLFTADGRKVNIEEPSGNAKKSKIELKESVGDGFYILVIRQGRQDFFEKIVVCK